jgi:predicted Zn-dependent protease
MKKFFIGYSIFLLLWAGVTFYACSAEGGINLFSYEDEVQLGRELDAEIRSTPQEYPIFQGDPSIKSYINNTVLPNVLSSSHIQHNNVYEYQIEIIDRDDVMNAFAIPGGRMYFYTGILKYLDSEAALAGIIGHEIAHIERRHATFRLTNYYGVSFLLSLVLGSNPSDIAEIASNLFVGIAFLANSLSDENEADEFSYKYLSDSKYYNGSLKFFFEKMRDDGLVSSNANSIQTFLSTHPDPIDRISDINGLLQQNGVPVYSYDYTGQGMYRTEYQQNILNKLP